MAHKMLSLTVLVALMALAGVGCKKDGADQAAVDKTYLTDTDQSKPLSGTVPGQEKEDPCKEAVGAMAVMFGGDCKKVTPAVCGNSKTESDAGEQCDNGAKNGKDGKCTADCKNVKAVIPSGAVKIMTPANDTQFSKCQPGKLCTITLKAEGMKGSNYNWTLVDAPSFKVFGGTATASLVLKSDSAPSCDAKDPKYDAKPCSMSVRVCPKGDSDASHCDTEKFVLAMDHLVISAYHLAGVDPHCISGGSACAPFKFGELLLEGKSFNYLSKEGGEVYFTEPKENDLLTSALVAARLSVEGSSVKDDQSFKWKMTVEGKDVPVVTHEEMVINGKTVNDENNTYYTFDSKLPKADVFLLNAFPEHHYILFSPTMYGKTANNIVITVTNAQGGEQSLTIPSVNVPNLNVFPAYQQQANLPAPAAASTKTTPLEINSIDANDVVTIGGINPMYGRVFSIEPEIDSLLRVKFLISDPYAPVTDIEQSSPKGSEWKIGNDKKEINYKFPDPGVPKDLNQTISVTVSTADGSNKTKALVVMKAKYPDPTAQTVASLSRVYLDMQTEWTDSDSKLNIQIQNNEGSVLAETGDFSVHGADPTEFNQSYKLNIKEEYKDLLLSQIGKIVVLQKDPGNGPDMIYYILTFRLISTYWYADICGTPPAGDGTFSLSLSTVFVPPGHCGGVWFGETDSNTDSDSYAFPTKFDNNVVNKWWPSSNVWKKRPHYGSPNEL